MLGPMDSRPFLLLLLLAWDVYKVAVPVFFGILSLAWLLSLYLTVGL